MCYLLWQGHILNWNLRLPSSAFPDLMPPLRDLGTSSIIIQLRLSPFKGDVCFGFLMFMEMVLMAESDPCLHSFSSMRHTEDKDLHYISYGRHCMQEAKSLSQRTFEKYMTLYLVIPFLPGISGMSSFSRFLSQHFCGFFPFSSQLHQLPKTFLHKLLPQDFWNPSEPGPQLGSQEPPGHWALSEDSRERPGLHTALPPSEAHPPTPGTPREGAQCPQTLSYLNRHSLLLSGFLWGAWYLSTSQNGLR